MDLLAIIPPLAIINSTGTRSIAGDLWLYFLSSQLDLKGTGSSVCISVCLTSLTPMYIQYLREMVPPPSQNTVGAWNQITLLILYHISSRLVTLLKVIDAPIQVPNIFYLTVSSKFLNFSFQICLPLFLKCLLASCLTLFRLSSLHSLGSCNHCILVCFLWSKKSKHSSSKHGLCCFRPRPF